MIRWPSRMIQDGPRMILWLEDWFSTFFLIYAGHIYITFFIAKAAFPFNSEAQAEFMAWYAIGRPIGRSKMDLLCKFQKEHISQQSKEIASSQKSLVRFMNKVLPRLPVRSHVIPVRTRIYTLSQHYLLPCIYMRFYYYYSIVARSIDHNPHLSACMYIQISETNDYASSDDEGSGDHKSSIKVYMVDIRAAIQRMFLHPHTLWDEGAPAAGYKSFSNTPFAQECDLATLIF